MGAISSLFFMDLNLLKVSLCDDYNLIRYFEKLDSQHDNVVVDKNNCTLDSTYKED